MGVPVLHHHWGWSHATGMARREGYSGMTHPTDPTFGGLEGVYIVG